MRRDLVGDEDKEGLEQVGGGVEVEKNGWILEKARSTLVRLIMDQFRRRGCDIFLLTPNFVGFFPHTNNQFTNTNWVSHNSILIQLPRASVRLHGLKGSAPQVCPHFRCQLKVLGSQANHTSV